MKPFHRCSAGVLIALAGASRAAADVELDLSVRVREAQPYARIPFAL